MTRVKLGLRSTVTLLEQVDQLAWVGRGEFDEWFPLYKPTSYCIELKMDFNRIKEHLLLAFLSILLLQLIDCLPCSNNRLGFGLSLDLAP